MNQFHFGGAGLKHLAIMIACCAIPIGVLLAVFVFNVDLGSAGFFVVMLMCPLLHLVMMRGMKGHQHQHGQVEDKEKIRP